MPPSTANRTDSVSSCVTIQFCTYTSHGVCLGNCRYHRRCAIALMLVVFVSPLCALSSALFSARVTHHIILIAGVAPLLARAFALPRLGYPPLVPVVAAHARNPRARRSECQGW